MMAERSSSNLLILISDEHRKDAMGCVGHPIVRTPNLDALAARGTIFENAYTPSPMCVPARAALACGDYVHKTRFWDSATPYNGSVRSWMQDIRDTGIDVTSIGKLHFRSGDDDNGFSQEILPMHVFNGVGWPIGLLRELAPDYEEAAELASEVGEGQSSYTDYDLAITEAAENWLQSKANSKQPWVGFISLVSPHYPLIAPKEFFNLYDPADMDLPIGYSKKNRPDHPELGNIARFFKYDQFFDEPRIRSAKSAYYGLISFMDACVGRILKTLEDIRQVDDTVVVYVSDHGDMMGDLGFWTKQVMYDSSAGVPMIAAGPGIPEGRRVKTGTSLLDLATTAYDTLGAEINLENSDKPGRSLREIAQAKDDPNRTILSEYHDGGSTTGTFMVCWQQWKYVYYVNYRPQLFNRIADPDELFDLAENSAGDLAIHEALREGERRLRTICDPENVNNQCFADQKRRINQLGGEAACLNAYTFNHTPAPTDQ